LQGAERAHASDRSADAHPRARIQPDLRRAPMQRAETSFRAEPAPSRGRACRLLFFAAGRSAMRSFKAAVLVAGAFASGCTATSADSSIYPTQDHSKSAGSHGGSTNAGAESGSDTCGEATPLVAFLGGDSIALRWSIIGKAADDVDHWVVSRNGAQIATVTPGFHPSFPEKDGKGYVDANIVAGASYEYRVEAVDAQGTSSTVGPPLCVKAPPALDAPPDVRFDTSMATDLADYSAQGAAFLRIWYPKLAYALATPDYDPIAAYTIRFDPSYDGLAYTLTSTTEIVVNPQWPRDHPQDFGMLLHESTHMLNDAKDTPGWILEGMADYSREYILHDRDPTPIGPNDQYTQGYSQASYFLNWIQETHQTPLVRTLMIASHQDVYSPSIFVDKTGSTIAKLWQALTGEKGRDPGPLHLAQLSNKCLDGGDGRAQVTTCTGADAQAWTWGAQTGNDGTLFIANAKGAGNDCLDIQSSGTANGSAVQTYPCNGSGAQRWIFRSDGTLFNPQSGRCLDDPNGSAADGTALQIFDCNGTSGQVFALPL
jgi:hypothetical protein